MPVRVGILSTAHLHVWSYVDVLRADPRAELVGFWDDDAGRLHDFTAKTGLTPFSEIQDLLRTVDAVVICSENVKHAQQAILALDLGRHVLCEKPLATTEVDAQAMIAAAETSGAQLMTAFPCRFSPAWARLKERVKSGDIGSIKAISSTNRGKCPFGWFVQKELSGGAALMDHVVHVADLFADLLQEEPSKVVSQVGNNVYGNDWEDTAMTSLEYPSGIFATLDSSWCYPPSHPTWGDVTMNVVGETGVIELDMFGQDVQVYGERHGASGYGTNLDAIMVGGFLKAVEEKTQVPVTGLDGLRALRVALKAYESLQVVAG